MQKRKSGQPHKGWKKAAQKRHERYRVGKYIADYSPLSPEEIAASDPELERLYSTSKPVLKS